MGQLGFFDLNRRYESPDRTALPPHPPSPAPRDRATRSGVGNRILESQAEKPHEREAVAKLVFRLIVRKIVERLQHQRLEDHHFIPWLASRRILAFRFAPAKLAFNQRRMQLGPERFERNHRGNRYKRIVLFGETFIASVQIKEAKLSHANLPRSEYENLESDLRGGGKRLFFEVPIYLIHHGKQLSRGLPCLLRFHFALILTRLACAGWRGDRVIPIRPGVSWP